MADIQRDKRLERFMDDVSELLRHRMEIRKRFTDARGDLEWREREQLAWDRNDARFKSKILEYADEIRIY